MSSEVQAVVDPFAVDPKYVEINARYEDAAEMCPSDDRPIERRKFGFHGPSFMVGGFSSLAAFSGLVLAIELVYWLLEPEYTDPAQTINVPSS